MYLCPHCHHDLVQRPEADGVSWRCTSCSGRAMALSVLRRNIGEKRLAPFWSKVVQTTVRDGCSCPVCSQAMTTAMAKVEGHDLTLDFCKPCSFVWFDASEFELFPPPPPKLHVLGEIDKTRLTPDMREKLAMAEVTAIAEKARAEDPSPDADWKTVPALFGLPVEIDSAVSTRTPWATYLLSLVIVAVSLSAFTNLRFIVDSYGLIPNQVWRDHGLTFLTSFFLHGGLFHLVGNVYFLLLFGRAVERDLGPWRWLLLIFAAHLTGSLLHILGDLRGDLPCIGASGGISGIITYYALKFPQARLGLLFSFAYVYWRWIQFPAWVGFFMWILLQGYGAFAQMNGLSNVSALAHFGGVAMGVFFWWVLRKRQMEVAPNASTNPLQVKIK